MQRILDEKRDTVSMAYFGDVYDTPPLWVRALMAVACLFGGGFMLYFLLHAGHYIPALFAGGTLVMAVFLVFNVPRASQTAIVTILYWTLLGVFAIFLPL